ncbi:MAG: LuxR C-terminal-related transcriptional regulator [Burkholderiales bacterium]
MKPVAVIVTSNAARSAELTVLLARLDPECLVRRFDSAEHVPAQIRGTTPRLLCIDTTNGDIPVPADSRPADGVRALFPATPILAMGASASPPELAAAARLGASSYLPDTYTTRQRELVVALAWEGLGHYPSAPGSEPPHRDDPSHTEDTYGLTDKQIEVLSCVASGMSNDEISKRLDIEVGTVKVHVTAIFRKLAVSTRPQAIVRALRMAAVLHRIVDQDRRGQSIFDWLIGRMSYRSFDAGSVLFRKGDRGAEVYYLYEGTVGLDEIGETMGPGTVFGEIAAFSPRNERTSTARCLTPVKLFSLDAGRVAMICYENPGFALHLICLLAGRLAAARGL